LRLTVEATTARLREPFVTSAGPIEARELLLVRLEDDDGAIGYGEAAPLGTPVEEVRAALVRCGEALATGHPAARARELAERPDLPPAARAALDMALWDLAGRRAGQPVWRLLGAADPAPVEVNWTIAAADRAGAAREASGARAAGYRCAKVKVGLGDDAGRLAAVRAAAGPEMALRLDANGAWSVEEAIAALSALEPVGIELCEEPVSGARAVARVALASRIPISIDETATASPEALDRRVCAAACMKVVACGGISGLLDAAGRARAAGYELYVASTLDGPLGIAAALHAAAALDPDRPCGLATLGLFDGRPDALAVSDGAMEVPRGPGLGEGVVGWYEA
jgi:L-Ala-D/L-Glu epimerase